MPGLALALALALAAPPEAAEPAPAPTPARPLVVGVTNTPPFVVGEAGERWTGTAMDLWRNLADELHLNYTLEPRDIDGLLRGLEDGSLDAAVAAITVTAEREQRVDFTHPFFTTGLAVAVAHRPPETWFDIFLAVFSVAFFRMILTFAAMQLVIGALMWLLERGHNPNFPQRPGPGLLAGLWWAVVTMATVGYGDKVPVTVPGRMLAMLWMLASLIILTTATASITTSLTINKLEAQVRGPEDLGKLRVGTITHSTSDAYLRDMKLDYRGFTDPAVGLAAIEAGQLDAFVFDRPLLTDAIADGHADTLELLPRTFHRQDYAFALPTGSPLRESVNRLLARDLAAVQDM